MYSDFLWMDRRAEDMRAEAAEFRLARRVRAAARRQRRQPDRDVAHRRAAGE